MSLCLVNAPLFLIVYAQIIAPRRNVRCMNDINMWYQRVMVIMCSFFVINTRLRYCRAYSVATIIRRVLD
jgi:hypothetical protein